MNLSGQWVGQYVQAWKSETVGEHHVFAIEAELILEGCVLTGTMRDLRTTSQVKYAEAIRHTRSYLNWIERRRVEDYVARYPDAIYRSELPEHSELVGSLVGNAISLTKSYLGPYDTAFCVHGSEQITRVFDHKVLYVGEVNHEGSVIAGHYRCPPEAALDPRVVATFELRRRV